MLPYFNIFGFKINAYYSMMLVGYIVMVLIMILRRKRFSLSVPKAIAFTTLLMFSGVLGCKLLFILENIQQTLENGVSLGGFSFFGAVFFVPPLMILFGKLFKLNAEDSLNASALCVCAMVGTIRIGCFFNGCCGGNTYHFSTFEFVFPTQLVESAIDFIILTYLLAIDKKGIGKLYPRFMYAYSSARLIIEFFRDTSKDWLGLSHGQWFSIAALITATVWIYLSKKPAKHKEKAR